MTRFWYIEYTGDTTNSIMAKNKKQLKKVASKASKKKASIIASRDSKTVPSIFAAPKTKKSPLTIQTRLIDELEVVVAPVKAAKKSPATKTPSKSKKNRVPAMPKKAQSPRAPKAKKEKQSVVAPAVSAKVAKKSVVAAATSPVTTSTRKSLKTKSSKRVAKKNAKQSVDSARLADTKSKMKKFAEGKKEKKPIVSSKTKGWKPPTLRMPAVEELGEFDTKDTAFVGNPPSRARKAFVTAIILLGLFFSGSFAMYQMTARSVQASSFESTVPVSDASDAREAKAAANLQSAPKAPLAPTPRTLNLATLPKERLSIAKLDIQAALEEVGTTTGGKMGLPSKPENVAWFKLGSKIGEAGNAVIAGHLDQPNGDPAIFAKLGNLAVGDTFEVYKGGEKMTFAVEKKKSIKVTDSAGLVEVFGPSKETRLNLVTCWGDWDRDNKTYTDRLVVFTKLVKKEKMVQ